MFILVKISVEVDVDGWNAEYGTSDSPLEIREQVKSLAVDSVDLATKHLQPQAIRKVEER